MLFPRPTPCSIPPHCYLVGWDFEQGNGTGQEGLKPPAHGHISRPPSSYSGESTVGGGGNHPHRAALAPRRVKQLATTVSLLSKLQ